MIHHAPRLVFWGFPILLILVIIVYSVSQATTLTTTAPALEQAHQLMDLATAAMAKANHTLDYAYQTAMNPATIRVAETAYFEGRAQWALALATLQKEAPAPSVTWGNASIVAALALEALHYFHTTITTIAQHWADVSLIPDWRSLNDTISRYQRYIDHVATTLQTTQVLSSDYDYARLTKAIADAKQHVTWAATNLTWLDINRTTQNLQAARAVLGQIDQELTQLTSSVVIKGAQILQFIDASRQSLITYQATAEGLSLNIENQTAEITANLDAAQQLTEADALVDAMSILRETQALLLDLAEEIAGEKSINP